MEVARARDLQTAGSFEFPQASVMTAVREDLPEMYIKTKRAKMSEPLLAGDPRFSASAVLSTLLEATGVGASTPTSTANGNTQHPHELAEQLMNDQSIASMAFKELSAALAPIQNGGAEASVLQAPAPIGMPPPPPRQQPREQPHHPLSSNGGTQDILGGATTADMVNAFGELSPSMVVCITNLLELQQRMASLESSTALHQEQISLQHQIAATVRRTIRAMVMQWRDLVVRMQLAISDHETHIRRHEEQISGSNSPAGNSNNALAARLDALENKVQWLESENASLRKELNVQRCG